jgi:DNA polymerase-3 subunit delta'
LKDSPQNHPDFFYLSPIKDQIQIDQIRELNYQLCLKPMKSNFKVAIIDSAEEMTLEAQNCFLKTLEEPKGNSVIILIAENEKMLLPTIVSRCQKIKFFPIEKEKIRNFLKKRNLSDQKIEKILKFSQGRIGLVIELLDEKKLEEFENFEENLKKIKGAAIWTKFQYLKKITSKFDFFEILEILANHFRENLFDQRSREILEEIQKIYFLAKSFNVDKKLALEILFLKI